MGFLDRLRAFLSGDTSAPLVDYPHQVRSIEVPKLQVHTANLNPDTDEKLVILTVASVAPLSRVRSPLRLTCAGERPVTFVPVDFRADPALDPNLGWIIPVTPETATELDNLPEGPGAHELASLHLGIIVDGDDPANFDAPTNRVTRNP